MTENQNFYTDALQAFDVPAAPQKETAVETEILPAPAPEKKRRPRWMKVLCGLLCAVLLAGIGLEVWLEHRPLPDTDPNAPFQDLSDRTKEKVKKAIEEYYSPSVARFWLGEPPTQDWQDPLEYGMRYYGTFGGYHIVLAPIATPIGMPMDRAIEEYRFHWPDSFHIYAYKDGKVMELEDAYELGLISKSQLDMIYQCFEQYNHEVYLGKDA